MGSPEFIDRTYHQPNLVNVIRLKNNRAVGKRLSDDQREQRRAGNADQRGANAINGQKYKLNEIEQWNAGHITQTLCQTASKLLDEILRNFDNPQNVLKLEKEKKYWSNV